MERGGSSGGPGWRSLAIAGLALLAIGAFLLLRTDSIPEGASTVVQPIGATTDTPRGDAPSMAAPAGTQQAPSTLLPGDRDGQPRRVRVTVRLTGLALPLELDPPWRASLESAATEADSPRAPPTEAAAGAVELLLESAPGEFRLRAGAWSPLLAEATLTIADDDLMHAIDATAYSGFAGRVIDDGAHPIAGARVTVRDSAWRSGPTPNVPGDSKAAAPTILGQANTMSGRLTATTRPDGSFTLPFLPPESLYRIQVSAPNRRALDIGPLSPDGQRIRQLQDFVLPSGRTIQGRVLDSKGLPVPNCPVTASLIAARGSATGNTGPDGRFQFPGLPPGLANVWTDSRTAVNAGQRIDEPGDADVTLVLQEGVWIDVTARHEDGEPAGGVLLIAFPVKSDDPARVGELLAMPRRAMTSADGHARLGPFAPGRVRVKEPAVSFLDEEVTAPGTVELLLTSAKAWNVPFRFLDQASGAPVRKPGNLAVRWGDSSFAGSVRDLTVTPDKRGEWNFERETPDDPHLKLTFTFAGYAPAIVTDVPDSTDEEHPVEVRLESESVFVVQLVDAAGQPVREASVQLVWMPDGAEARASLEARQDRFNQTPFTGLDAQPAYGEKQASDGKGLARFTRVNDGPVGWAITAPGFIAQAGRQDTLAPASNGTSTAPDLLVTLLSSTESAAPSK